MTLDTRIAKIQGRAVAVPGNEIDTDRIMPARYLKCVTFEKLGEVVFQDERFDEKGAPKKHPLNDPRHRGANILVVNKNFGCGSSREHAPQGILRSGIKAVLGESFAEIFAGNCAVIGLPVATAGEQDVRRLMDAVEKDPSCEVTLDIEGKKAVCGELSFPVSMPESARKSFLEGTWDSTAILMSARDEVRRTAERLPYLKGTVKPR
ncbi:MAG TPA: 3-isopropylmalate dehydratase small subunit [Elusimicrobiota bacterium]|nr:3-isopropylmalate dehydratase small subunit [Elusimicrobiota bacterium]